VADDAGGIIDEGNQEGLFPGAISLFDAGTMKGIGLS